MAYRGRQRDGVGERGVEPKEGDMATQMPAHGEFMAKRMLIHKCTQYKGTI